MHGVDRAVGGRRRPCGPGHRGRDTEAGLLALHIHRIGHCAALRQLRRTRMLGQRAEAHGCDQQNEHRQEDCDALLFVLHAIAEGEAARCGNQEQRQHFTQVGQGRWVLQRMRGVQAVVAAAVGAQLLDSNLAGRRAHGDIALGNLHLLRHRRAVAQFSFHARRDRLKELIRHMSGEVLNDALGGLHQRQGHQHIHHTAHHIRVEGAHAVLPDAAQAANQREHDGDAHRGGDEVLHAQAEHLREVAECRLTGIRLPVGVRHEGRRRVEAQMPAGSGHSLGVERQHALQQLHGPEREEAEQVEQHAHNGVLLPAHILVFVDSQQAVDALFNRAKHGRQQHPVAVHNLEQIFAKRPRQRREQRQIQAVLKSCVHLQFLSLQQHIGQIDQHRRGNDACQDEKHLHSSLAFPAPHRMDEARRMSSRERWSGTVSMPCKRGHCTVNPIKVRLKGIFTNTDSMNAQIPCSRERHDHSTDAVRAL